MVDTMLLVFLVVLLPGYQMWRSRTEAARPPRSRSATYVQALIKPALLVALLAFDWLVAGRPISLLGLDWPLSRGGSIGFAIAFAILIALAAIARFRKPSSDHAVREEGAIMHPETTEEVWLFVLFAVTLGVAWELLYRGFLLWALEPHISTVGAIIVAATAYGCAHGYKSAGRFTASIASAFVFTIAYALSRSLWWLMLLHAALPLMGAWLSRSRRQ